MNCLNEFKEDINNCSRCGLCQAVCPIFELTKNDCASPKGKFIMLNEMFKNSKSPSKKMKDYITMCLNCSKCFDYCPSKLDIVKINSAFEKDFSSLFEKFLSLFYSFYLEIYFLINLLICRFTNFKPKNISKESTIYVKPVSDKNLPETVKTKAYKVVEIYEIPFLFRLKYLKLTQKIEIKNFEIIMKENQNTKYILVNNKNLFMNLKKVFAKSKNLKNKVIILPLVEF